MVPEAVLASQKKVNILLVYPQFLFGLYMIFLGPAKFSLTYWNKSKC